MVRWTVGGHPTLKADGTTLSTSSDSSTDVTLGTYYASPDDHQLPGHCEISMIRRNRLVEVGRFGSFVDLVTPVSSPSERLVFKHYEDDHGDARLRNLMVDPATDNLIIIDLGKALRHGHFTSKGTCVFHSPSYRPLPFTVQPTLPTTLGTAAPEVEGEYSPLPSALQLPPTALGTAAAEVEEEERDEEEYELDVNAAIVAVHDLVTRDTTDRTWEATECGLWNGIGTDAITTSLWTAHPSTQLASSAEAYRAALVSWLQRRRADPRRHAPTSPLAFPDYMPVPRADKVRVLNYNDPLYPYLRPPSGITSSVKVSGRKFHRRECTLQLSVGFNGLGILGRPSRL
ncbi:hypothetical protein B0H67DRAFT_547639 [Lasiosphaeris hirsuta]|uniref:Uncharacterized protein n=1 Tax=Lasiosphaeris hirsuta TaxID=260670 RepID=A0AA40B8K1_9PEZI|nr:hypothetical protein B0H67DRAFT_547639 [Lasiosphaeris hirsuta]